MNDKATRWRDINNRMQARRSLRTVIVTALSAAGARLFFDRHPGISPHAGLIGMVVINRKLRSYLACIRLRMIPPLRGLFSI